MEFVFIVFLIFEFDIALKREGFVVSMPAFLSVKLVNRQLEQATTQSWEGMGLVPSCPSVGKTLLVSFSASCFFFVDKIIGTKGQGTVECNEVRMEVRPLCFLLSLLLNLA